VSAANSSAPALALAVAVALAASGCSPSRGADAADRLAYAQVMKDSTVVDLVRACPETEDRFALGAGWAVLGMVGPRVLLPGVADGIVVTHDNTTGRESYLKLSGAIARDLRGGRLRAVLFFDDSATFRRFADEGWDFGPAAPAKGIEIVAMVEGLPAPDVSLDGARVRPDADMNAER
jgi:hypothetical protein